MCTRRSPTGTLRCRLGSNCTNPKRDARERFGGIVGGVTTPTLTSVPTDLRSTMSANACSMFGGDGLALLLGLVVGAPGDAEGELVAVAPPHEGLA